MRGARPKSADAPKNGFVRSRTRGGLGVAGEPPVGRVAVDGLGQFGGEAREELVARQACLLRQRRNDIRADSLFQFVGSQLAVRARTDPGARGILVPGLAEALHEL